MENSPENCNVKVALHIRPLLRQERRQGAEECLDVVPGTSQVLMGSHSFIFDHIYGGGGSPSINMFDECVAPLLDALFQGYNSTIIAYGQTGSGKTYTMGTAAPKEGSHRGLIFQVMNTIFNKIETLKDQTEFQLHVSFIEILKEEVRDLLDSTIIDRLEGSDGHPENAVPGKQPVQVRKASDGAVTLSGSTEVSVSTQKEMIACLEQGCSNRSVASTDMNSQSSRSHAIFTIILEQKDKTKGESDSSEIMGEEYKCAKLHLVDLAGSERAKRAGSEGVRLKEGIQINKGLLALGNVISALGDEKKRKEGQHIPYRDSKLTRLLQASLGGNCKTVMIACVSPADFNAEETLNTLKYANRARNIQNKASVQKEVFPADTHKLRQQLRLLQAELTHRKEAEIIEVQDLKKKIDLLEATNSELLQKLDEYRSKCAVLDRCERDAQEGREYFVKRDGHKRGSQCTISSEEIKRGSQCMTSAEAIERGSQCSTSPKEINESVAIGIIASETLKGPSMKIKENDLRQNTLHEELNDLDKRLEQKESGMKLLESPDLEALKRRFGKKIFELEEEKRSLLLERDNLRAEIASLEALGKPTTKMQTMNEEKLEEIEISELEKKQEQQIEALKQKHHDAMKRLQDEIRCIKSQKVQLQQKVKHEEEQFRQWKASHEKQMLQVRKESRKTEFERHKLLALYQRQTQVLQRKSEEAARATKKLKELLELRKMSQRRESVVQQQPSGQKRTGQIKALKRWLNHELDKVMHAHKLRIEHGKQTQSHAKLKEELSFLKQMDKPSSHGSRSSSEENRRSRRSSVSPNTRATRIVSLESRVKSSSDALAVLSSQISEAGRADLGAGRWKMLHSLGDAKDLLQYLFNIATDARCRFWEKEVEMKEAKVKLDELIKSHQKNNNNNNNNNNKNNNNNDDDNNNRDASAQTTSNPNSTVSSLTKKWKEIEDQGVQSARTPIKESQEMEGQKDLGAVYLPPTGHKSLTASKRCCLLNIGKPFTRPKLLTNALILGKAPTPFDIFADMGIEFPLPFPESRPLDFKAGICSRPVREIFKQTQKMVPIAHLSMKKLPLEEQKGKISRWRRSHDEWLIQFKWRWQKPWKLSQLNRISDAVRNSDETLKGQDLSIKLGQTT